MKFGMHIGHMGGPLAEMRKLRIWIGGRGEKRTLGAAAKYAAPVSPRSG